MRSGLLVLAILTLALTHLTAQEPKTEPKTEPKQEPAEATKKDQEALQGSWELEQLEVAGKKMTADDVKKAEGKITIEGTNITFLSAAGKEGRKGTLTLDAGKSPRWIDLDDGKKGKELGIYELTGDALKLCAARGGERPKEFASKAMPESYLMVFKRAKKE